MDPDMIRPRRCKPCPPPPPPSPPPAPPSPKKEEPPPSPHGEHVIEPCQHECCYFRGYPFPPQSYWYDDVNRFSRWHRMKSLEMGYRMNFGAPTRIIPDGVA
ncbi:hypothetical protein P3S68_009940 [Capsicum galapagoense]